MGSDLFGSVALGLLSFDRVQRLRIRDGALRYIKFPERPHQSNGSACAIELKPVS
jgi:hypothetical protein